MIAIWFSAVMIVLVTCGAFLFAFTDVMSDRLSGNKRTLFVCILGAYSVYRALRLKSQLKRRPEE
jgi:hypothetical protein